VLAPLDYGLIAHLPQNWRSPVLRQVSN